MSVIATMLLRISPFCSFATKDFGITTLYLSVHEIATTEGNMTQKEAICLKWWRCLKTKPPCTGLIRLASGWRCWFWNRERGEGKKTQKWQGDPKPLFCAISSHTQIKLWIPAPHVETAQDWMGSGKTSFQKSAETRTRTYL